MVGACAGGGGLPVHFWRRCLLGTNRNLPFSRLAPTSPEPSLTQALTTTPAALEPPSTGGSHSALGQPARSR